MILQALCDYYDRKTALDSESLAPMGFQYKEIPFLIVIDEQGTFKQLKNMQEEDDKKRKNRSKALLVPQEIKRTSGKAANLLWDNPKYILGYSNESKKQQDAIQAQTLFIEKIRSLPSEILVLTSIQAVLRFLESNPLEAIQEAPEWKEVMKSANALLTFQVGFKPATVCEETNVFELLQKHFESISEGTKDSEKQICLVTGEKDDIERLHPRIKGVMGAQSVGADIVSFNLDAFNSYGKKQGFNAPVGKKAAFAYTTALNTLLGKDSKQKLQLGGTTVVFWAEKPTEKASILEIALPEITNEYNFLYKDDPNARTRWVKALYESPWKGISPAHDDERNRFFVLGLAPNYARIAISFYHVLPLEELDKNIRQHFKDLTLKSIPSERVKKTAKKLDYLSISRLIKTLELDEEREKKMKADFFQSILLNAPYPWEILQMVLQSVYAESKKTRPFDKDDCVSFEQASLIKGFLTRKENNMLPVLERDVLKPELDRESRNKAYRLGWAFAVIETIQEKADRNIKATIGKSYYAIASLKPAVVVRRLEILKTHWLSVLERKNWEKATLLKRELEDAFRLISTPFPDQHQLNLIDQGNFTIGYYHARQECRYLLKLLEEQQKKRKKEREKNNNSHDPIDEIEIEDEEGDSHDD